MESEEKTQNNAKEISRNRWLRTLAAGGGALMLMVFIGIHEAQSAVMLPQLKNGSNPINVTPNEESWIASLGVMMAPISALTVGPLIDAYGRKKGLQFYFFSTCVAHAVMFCANEVYQIYIGRFITGIGMGLMVCSVVYLVEICTVKQRETLSAVTFAAVPVGVLLMNTIGGYLSWRIASFIFSLLAFALFIGQCFIPETPPWLFKRGKEDAAIRSLRTLGRSESSIQRELDSMKMSCKDDSNKVELQTFLKPTVWKPFIIMVVFFFFQSAVGTFDLLFYSVNFIERLGTSYSPLDVTVVLSIFRLLACCTILVIFRRKFGRRFSVIFSASLMTVVLLGAGTYECIEHDVSVTERPVQWFPITCMVVYIVANLLGVLNLPWLMSGEVFPLKVRGVMTGVSHVVGHSFIFISIKTYYLRMDALHIQGIMFFYVVVSFAAILFGIFVLPETSHKSLQEIEDGFLPKHKRKLESSVQTINTIA